MDSTADYFAETLKTPVFRMTMKSPDLNYRLRAAHGLMHLAVTEFGVAFFILAGQSNGARVCCDLAYQIVSAGFNATSDGILKLEYNKCPKAHPTKELLMHLEDYSG